MCGVAGFVGRPGTQDANVAVAAMCEQMRMRGPDDNGVEDLSSPAAHVVLGSTRLAIIDPSPSGHQPMRDRERGTTVVFNGMIYNFRELRAELESAGERFRSDCDTEVVLRAYGRWGRAGVRRLHGMFAFAIWDERERTLLLARDRLGIKPLYYVERDGTIGFASTVKALVAAGVSRGRLSDSGLRTYLSFGAVSEPLTAVEDVRALPAAHFAVLREGRLSLECYWNPGTETSAEVSRSEAARELEERLAATVREHLVSDAPLGVFLSGGLDSSFLAALAARATTDVRTVSVEFEEPDFTEAPFMRLMADRIGSDHVSVTLRPTDLLAWQQDAFEAMDQPTSDGINTYIVSRAAAESGLKVALSGLGADELFDGYGHVHRVRMLERLRRLPRPLARAVGIAARGRARRDKLDFWTSGRAGSCSSYDLVRRLFLPADVAGLSGSNGKRVAPTRVIDRTADLYDQVSVLDLTNYMRNVLLRDTDAMSMANSLEVRVPYLDHTLVEWALSLPANLKGARKRLLLDAARGAVPTEVTDRQKHGFLLPIDRWLRRDLAAEIEATLHAPPPSVAEVLEAPAVAGVWEAYREGRATWLRPWALFAYCRWAETLR